MGGGLWYYTGGNDQNHSHEKEMQKGKMVEEALQIAEKRREAKAKEKSKDTPMWMQNSKE